MAKQINNWNTAEGSLSVSLYKNPFTGSGYLGKVKRRNVALDILIGMIASKHPGVSEGLLQIAAGYMQEEILELLGLGYSVNILELGTLYLAPTGSIAGDSTSDIPTIEARFTPSDTVKSTAASVSVETVVVTTSEPEIKEIIDTANLDGDGASLTKNRLCRLTGTKLKLGGESYGIFFVPVQDDGNLSAAESEWISVDESSVVTNQPKKLEFYVPDSLSTEASYSIAVRTMLSSSSTTRKSAVTGYSSSVTVRDAD